MNYKELLNRLIKTSGLTNVQIVNKCKELGEKITPNYLSVLKNQEDKIASENLSIAIAKACNSDFDDLLVVQGYLDKAPKVILEFLEVTANLAIEAMRVAAKQETEQIMKDESTEDRETKIAQIMKYIDKISIAEIICATQPQDLKNMDVAQQLQGAFPREKKWALVEISGERDVIILDNKTVQKLGID